NTIFMVDPATGRAVSLFTDNDPRVREINGISYDPYKRIIYYSVDGLERCTPAGTPDSIRQIKKYDVNTGTISNVISNVNQTPFNIPTFQYGLESAGAAFYNGSLFVGVEGYKLNSDTKNSGRKTVIWRVDFASDSITPTKACQVWAIPVDNGTNNVHDWADFVIKDGVLYNSNSSVNAVGGSGNGLYYHINLQTNTLTTTVNPNTPANKPAQSAQTWDGKIYWLSNEIGLYNGTSANTVTGKQTIANAARSVTWVGPAGDAGEAFKPKADFGDAPSSYDPVASSPAIHERDTALRIGTYGWEWTKNTSSLANGDPDEDGVATVPLLSQSGTGYLVPVNVWNNTGANATLIGWLDYNNNGVFDASEASATITVGTMASMQSKNLTWSSTPNSFTLGDHTFLRIRLTSAANGMTASNPTGYFRDGEVEDYRVTIGEYPLDVKLLSFNVKGYNNKTAVLSWTTTSEDGFEGFEVERSADGAHWTTAGSINAKGQNRTSVNDYVFTDMNPFRGKTYYRLKLLDANGQMQYSEIRTVAFKNFVEEFRIAPNPTREQTSITVEANSSFMATLTISDFMGRSVYTTNVRINAGSNVIPVNGLSKFNNGIYMVQLVSDEINISGKLMISK
ncbi:MAG: GEVED domain-containing protein, partial [Chitinophagaceae bacterium]